MNRIWLRNGILIDGTGAPAVRGDVLIAGERIAEIGHFAPPAEAEIIDCTGLAVAPGFIDAHSHSDLQTLENRPEKARQGVTTEVVGNCGFSPYPAGAEPRELREFANGIFCGNDRWGWNSARDYIEEIARRARLATVITQVGHGSLRIAHAGHQLGPLAEPVLDAMEGTLAECLQQGARGFSTGLMYSPGASAPFEELERLCRVVARHGAIYTTHMRDYMARLPEAVEEQLELARRTGCRLHISHLQAVGPANWEKQAVALEMIERARTEGVDVAFDCYPYTAGSSVLTQLLPQWALEGGTAAMLARLQDPAERKRVARETVIAQRWADVFISAVASPANQWAVGRNMAEIAETRGVSPEEATIDLLIEERGDVNFVSFNQSEENLRRTLTHPYSNIISDGFYVRGRPHPRLYGTFPFLLGSVCRAQGWMRLEEAVHKITAKPAERFNIAGRGRLAAGYFADITVFDPATVDSPATYENPTAAPVGIVHVFRNGNRMLPVTN